MQESNEWRQGDSGMNDSCIILVLLLLLFLLLRCRLVLRTHEYNLFGLLQWLIEQPIASRLEPFGRNQAVLYRFRHFLFRRCCCRLVVVGVFFAYPCRVANVERKPRHTFASNISVVVVPNRLVAPNPEIPTENSNHVGYRWNNYKDAHDGRRKNSGCYHHPNVRAGLVAVVVVVLLWACCRRHHDWKQKNHFHPPRDVVVDATVVLLVEED